MSYVHLHEIEEEKIENPSFFKIIALLNTYNLSIAELVNSLDIKVRLGNSK